MLTTLLTLIVAGLLVFLLVDGAKHASKLYAGADQWTRLALVWGLAIALVLVIRGFELPGTLAGWLGLLASIAAIGLVSQGVFRQRHPKPVKRASKSAPASGGMWTNASTDIPRSGTDKR